MPRGLTVISVDTGSPADQACIAPGDQIAMINGEPVHDIIDYQFLCAADLVKVVVNRGETRRALTINKGEASLGLAFADPFGPTARCANHCLFCFVDQLPPGLRSSLYLKDDDFRHSFWYGNFITLTNVSDGEMKRITSRRLSPLYISVHATDPKTRVMLMGNRRAGKIMSQLNDLAGAGISFHAQVVLCPGINDGLVLQRTVEELGALYPALSSLALVPVGLSDYRQSLPELQPFTPEQAGSVLDLVHGWQRKFTARWGEPLVHAADEFYLLAGEDYPASEVYGEFAQLENGVGMVRLFNDSWAEVMPIVPKKLGRPRHVILATGVLGAKVQKPVVDKLNGIQNLRVDLVPVENRLFGASVTASGLLGARDIIRSLNRARADLVLIPPQSLNQERKLFLDGESFSALEQKIGIPVRAPEDIKTMVRLITGDKE